MKFLSLILLLGAVSSHARWLTKQESGSVIEKFFVKTDVQKNGASAQEVDYAVRVQSEDAKTSASVFTIEYNSLVDKVDVIEAYTLNGKTRVNVDKAAIERRDKGEAKDYDAIKVCTVVFPQVQIGSRLFIKYRVASEKPVIEDRWSTLFSLYPGMWVEKFGMDVHSERPLYYEFKDPRGLANVKQKDKFTLSITNKRELPGYVHAEKDPYFHPDSFTDILVSTEQNWQPFLDGVNKDFEKIQTAGLPPKLEGWIKEAARKKTPEEQILVLMEKMSREFRYFGDWRRHNGGIMPRALTEIESSRYGDCKDLSSLLVSMLRRLKVPANVALVRRGDNPYGQEADYKLPILRFNHAIVAVQLPNQTYWLDPTNPVSSLKAFPDIAGRPAYVLDPKNPRFERLPEIKPTDLMHVHDYEYRFRTADTVAVKVSAQLKDLAPYHLANELMMRPKSEVLSSTLDYFSEGQEVRSFKYTKEPQTGRVLKDMPIAIDLESGRVTYNAGKAAFFVIPDAFLAGAFYETDARESDLKLGEEPYSYRGVRRLKDTRLVGEAPEACHIESEWMTLNRLVKADGKDVIVSQQIDLKRPYIKREEFRSGPFRKLQEQAKRCFSRTGILVEPTKAGLS